MNNKLKRAVAIIALIFILLFTVALILYLFDRTMLNGAIGDVALWFGVFGILLFVVLRITHSFPSQQRKDEERDRLYKEAEEQALSNESGEESSDEENTDDETTYPEENTNVTEEENNTNEEENNGANEEEK